MEEKSKLVELIEKLEYAKKATETCLKDSSTWVDMKGLEYWAKRVVDLRKQIKELI